MTTTILFGDLRTGKITDSLDVTGASWKVLSNDAGSVDSVVIEAHEVAAKSLYYQAAAAKTFIAADVDGTLQEAGPLWSRGWDDKAYQLTLGAAGLWSLFDHRKVIPVLVAGQKVQSVTTTVSNTDYGGIARALVAQALTHVGGNLPLALPAALAGTHTETFPGWQLLALGDQLRQLTKRETAAPDIRFRPSYTADKLSIQWAMEVGTQAAPLLAQTGDDWYFDHSVAKSSVENISTDEDATQMGQRGWITGNGQDLDTVIGSAYDSTLVDAGWPLLEVDELRSNDTAQATVDGYAANLVARSARPITVWNVVVSAAAAAQVLPGHYARVTPKKNHPWLPPGERRMRVKSKSGDLGETVTLEMYPLQATL